MDLKSYDWKFPVEQQDIVRRIEFVQAHPDALAAFRGIVIPTALADPGGPLHPEQFLAKMTAYLWASLQMDAYRQAADRFVDMLKAASSNPPPPLPRLVMLCIGRDADSAHPPLFQKLLKFGQLRTNVVAGGASDAFLGALARRAARHPEACAHWYVDGGSPLAGPLPEAVVQLSYPALAPMNKEVLQRIMTCIQEGSGPEILRTQLAEISLRLPASASGATDPRLQHFAMSLLTEGSGTQIFSTTFVQWTIREVLRRAQPATLFARFAPRQRQKPFNAMVEAAAGATDLDPAGSLIDADMAAYYAYLEMNRLPGADRARFAVWFENHSLAFVAGSGVATGTVNDAPVALAELVSEFATGT